MNFTEYAAEDAMELSKEFFKLMKIYYMEKLEGFDEEQKIKIVNAAITHLFCQLNICNINMGYSSINKFMNKINFIVQNVKKNITPMA